jgi:hypothetical protein
MEPEEPPPIEKGQKVTLRLRFEELGVHRRASLGLLPNVEDPELNDRMQFSRLKSSRRYRFIDNFTVTLSGGYRLCRANRPLLFPGRYYWEIEFRSAKASDSHVRLGIATLRADMEGPVGVDTEGYSIRDLGGKIHNADRTEFSPFSVGDTIGFFLESTGSGAQLHVSYNGISQGIVFENIDESKRWNPAISIYRDSEVYGRFNRPFNFEPGEEWTPAAATPDLPPTALFTSREIVRWMKGVLDAGDLNLEAWQTIEVALTPPHELPI